MNLDILKKIGLSEGEIKIYNALLEIGITSINKIHERVGIDRRNIYDILNKLIEKGLASYIEENGKRTFKISAPEKILSYIEEKKSGYDSVKEKIEEILPAIHKIISETKSDLYSEIFRGPEGLKAVWDDMLNYGAIYWIGSGNYVPQKFPAYWKEWNQRRIKRKVKSLHLFRYEKRKEVDKKIITSCKFLPKEFSGNPAVIVTYGNKVAQMLFNEQITVFVIQSKELSENYKQYHKYLWEHVAKD